MKPIFKTILLVVLIFLALLIFLFIRSNAYFFKLDAEEKKLTKDYLVLLKQKDEINFNDNYLISKDMVKISFSYPSQTKLSSKTNLTIVLKNITDHDLLVFPINIYLTQDGPFSRTVNLTPKLFGNTYIKKISPNKNYIITLPLIANTKGQYRMAIFYEFPKKLIRLRNNNGKTESQVECEATFISNINYSVE